jgi:phosphoglycolate phosphatase-like HAD superfamily hydrolase
VRVAASAANQAREFVHEEEAALKQSVSVLITDLDNTLFDWMEMWYRSFSAMLSRIVSISGIDVDVLENEIKTVHERYGTSEYAFLIEELPSLRRKHPGQDLTKIYAEAINEFRTARKASLALYPTVWETLCELHQRGCLLVGYTESLEFYATYRLRYLGLDELLDYVYFPPDHDLPSRVTRESVRFYEPERYLLRFTQPRHTPKGELKPNPELLLHILAEVGGQKETTVYIGDKLVKDVFMAQSAGITDVWAKYGEPQPLPEYELLTRVTYWTDEAVEVERSTTEQHVIPTYIVRSRFEELLELFEFVRFQRGTL